MNKLDMILENVCMNHVNMNSKLPEAVTEAISKNKVSELSDMIFESFNGIVINESTEDKSNIMKYLEDVWNTIVRFFNTLINKVKNIFIDKHKVFKNDVEFLNKNRDAIKRGSVLLTDEERTIKYIDVSNVDFRLIKNSIVDEILKKEHNGDGASAYVDNVIASSWSAMTGVNYLNPADMSKFDKIVKEKAFTEDTIKADLITSYLGDALTIVAEGMKGLDQLSKALNSATYSNIKSYFNNNDITKESIDTVIRLYRKMVNEFIKCYNTIIQLTNMSKENMMRVAKLAVSKDSKKSK